MSTLTIKCFDRDFDMFLKLVMFYFIFLFLFHYRQIHNFIYNLGDSTPEFLLQNFVPLL